MSDWDLVQALERGDEDAWRHLISTYGAVVYAAARRVGLRSSDQEEVLQNTCLAVYKSIGSLRDPAKLDSWLYSIAYRFALNLTRRHRSEVPVEDIGEREPPQGDLPGPSIQEALEALEDAQRIRELTTRLDDRCRVLITALYLQDPPLSYEEITRRFGIPIGSIGPTRARCLKKLQKLLEAVSGDAPA